MTMTTPLPFCTLSRDCFMTHLARAGFTPNEVEEIIQRWQAYWEQDPAHLLPEDRGGTCSECINYQSINLNYGECRTSPLVPGVGRTKVLPDDRFRCFRRKEEMEEK